MPAEFDYMRLGEAIIVMAVKDLANVYADFRKIILRGGKIDRVKEYRAYRIEKFFFSDLYSAITKINGQRIIDLLRKEAGIEKNNLDWRVSNQKPVKTVRSVRHF